MIGSTSVYGGTVYFYAVGFMVNFRIGNIYEKATAE